MPTTTRLHYAWVIALCGLLTIFAGLGLGRFALGLLLPDMGRGLLLDYSQMGLVSTANFVGYLLAVLYSARLMRRFGARRTISVSLLVTAAGVALLANSGSFLTAATVYLVAGLGSGGANVPIMALVSHWFGPRLRGRAASMMVAGNGLAILLTGLLIPPANAALGIDGWRIAWMALAALVAASAVVCAVLLREDPSQLGLHRCGERPTSATDPSLNVDNGHSILRRLSWIYLLFGSTYVVFTTFVVTAIIDDRGYSAIEAGQLWALIGGCALFGGPLFGALSDRIGRRLGLMLVMAMQLIAFVLVTLPLGVIGIMAAVIMFGLSAWSVPSLMAAVVGDYLGSQRAAEAFGKITLYFGAGQIVGPALAGWLAETGNGFGAAFAGCSMLIAVAIALSWRLPDPPHTPS